MRDPARIRPLLDRLAAAWERCPDLRLGQIISNAVDVQDADFFTIEDEALIAAIEALLGRGRYITPPPSPTSGEPISIFKQVERTDR